MEKDSKNKIPKETKEKVEPSTKQTQEQSKTKKPPEKDIPTETSSNEESTSSFSNTGGDLPLTPEESVWKQRWEKHKNKVWISSAALLLLIGGGVGLGLGLSSMNKKDGTEDTKPNPIPPTKETVIKIKASTEALSFKVIKDGLEIDIMTGEVSLEKLEEYFTITNAVDGATYIVEDFSQVSKRNEEYETKEATIKIKVDKALTGEVNDEGEDITTEKTFEIKFNTEELIVSATKITMKITEYKKTIADFSTELGVSDLSQTYSPTEIKIEKLVKFFNIDNGVEGATYSIKDTWTTGDGIYQFTLVVSEVYDENGETVNNVEENFIIKTNPNYVAPVMLKHDGNTTVTINSDWVNSPEYKDWDGELIIPSKMNNKSVNWMGENFASEIKGELKRVVIKFESNAGLYQIGENAFKDCELLEEVEIDLDNVRMNEVGTDAFYGCTNLKTFNFKNIKTLYKGAFEKSGLIGDITLNKSIDFQGWFIFRGCDNLNSITVPRAHAKNLNNNFHWAAGYWNGIPANEIGSNIKTLPIDQFDYEVNGDSISIESITNDYVEELKEMKLAGTWDGTITIPGEIEGKAVGSVQRAFRGHTDLGVKKIIFTEPVVEGGYDKTLVLLNGFGEDLPEVVEIVGTEYISRIGQNTFKNMRNLKGTMNLSGMRYDEIPENSFENCENLEDIIFPNLRAVKQSAFKGCTKFKPTQKQFFKKLVTIGNNAFENCTSLTNEIDISRINNIGYGAFAGCTNLEGEIYLRELTGVFPEQLFKGCNPEKLTVQVHDKAFGEIENGIATREMQEGSGTAGFEKVEKEEFLFHVDFDGMITSFNQAWFDNVPESMKADWENGIIRVPEYIDNIKVQSMKGNYNSNGSGAQKSVIFHESKKPNNDKIKEIHFAPGGLEKIGPSVFWDLAGLEVVTGLDNVAVAEDFIFNNCKNLKTVDFSDKLNDIKQWAFKECRSLEYVETKNVTSIGQDAFYYNYNFNPVATSFLNVKTLNNSFRLKFYDSRVTDYGEIFETIGWQNDVSFPKLTSTIESGDRSFEGITTGITIGLPSNYYETADSDSNSSLMFRFVGDIVNTDDSSAETKTLTHEMWDLNPNPVQKPTSTSINQTFEVFLKGRNFFNINKKD
ncbi:MAG: leucine-rich repeat protein [Mycoplasma sp.]